ncbi:hypothetical protein GCM10029964_083530 [Kibdelosporangium lantanae]
MAVLHAPARPGPVTGDPAGTRTWTTTFRIGPDEPVFAGHYPGLPILPGVAVIECVRAALVAGLGHPVDLVAIDSCRFTAAVRPGAEVSVSTSYDDTTGCCVAEVATEHGPAAKMRIRIGAHP